jgi:hypothetical protein
MCQRVGTGQTMGVPLYDRAGSLAAGRVRPLPTTGAQEVTLYRRLERPKSMRRTAPASGLLPRCLTESIVT